MAQQQAITYQYDLFDTMSQEVIRPFAGSEAVRGAQATKALQVKEAGEQERALTQDLMGAILSQSNIKQAYKQVKKNVYFTLKVYRYFNVKVYHFNIKSKLVLSFLEVPPKRIKRALLFW